MGIHNFISWLNANYGDSKVEFFNYLNRIYDDIYIDMNFIIHSCYMYANNESELKLNIFEKIKGFVQTYTPTKNLYLYFDGSSGELKRYTIEKRKNNTFQINKNISPEIFSHTSEFMKSVNNYTKMISTMYLNIKNNVNIIVNDSNEFGEAEIKIANNIIKTKDNKHKILLISNDSDSILISLCNNVNNIYILNNKDIISVDKIKNNFINKYKTSYLDFVLLTLFQGNDYFPKLKYASYKTIWKAYENYIKYERLYDKNKDLSIYQNGLLNDNFKTFINYLINALPAQYKNFKLTTNFLIENYNKQKYIQMIELCINLYCTGVYIEEYKTMSYNKKSLHPCVFLFK